MTGLDTNVLVRYLTRDDETQFRAAKRLLEDIESSGETAYISVIVLAELAWVLQISYGFERATLVKTLEQILETAEFTMEDRDLVAEAVSQFSKGKAGIADYLIGVSNSAAGCRNTATFDRALRGNPGFRIL
ncbi:MAG: type II toxin-antitoxin system VapC family toxin [Thermoanaerobaculia bacterium]